MIASPESLRSSLESNTRQAGWAIALRGVVAMILGVIAIRNPHIAAGAFVIFFSIYVFADGILDFVLASRLGRAGQRWGWYLFEGIVNIALGIVALAYPALTLFALVFLVGLRAIIVGTFELISAFSWDGLESRWLLGLTGVLSILLGVLLMTSPTTGGLALLWTLGVYAVVFGVMLFAIGLRLLSAERSERHLHEHAAATR
jgi:uncharacterized membrane protein HdeD (DUF308 family)